eukprot:CAMPEP_0179117102 /NCGR_PEP_ID=MMETSP0796-20121207/54978_1 /TAXON_ID=73915 /ORGANISM="Pyrodinium bahamense, Strain pbaha01" /LENGTH=200 /DNA_ID=CAMNT_0020815445 /DNA_START=51 /DNA_END=653 /DNA_ORIENTATION=+
MQLECDQVPWVALPPGGAPKGTREWSEQYPECISDAGHCPFVPTGKSQVDRILSLARIVADDVVCDLGSGDGSFLIRASAATGCRCVGVEINGDLVQCAVSRAADGHVSGLTDFTEGTFESFVLTETFAKATVVFVHLIPDVLRNLAPVLEERIAAGVRVVSQRFEIPSLEFYKQQVLASAPCDDDDYFKNLGQAFLYSR